MKKFKTYIYPLIELIIILSFVSFTLRSCEPVGTAANRPSVEQEQQLFPLPATGIVKTIKTSKSMWITLYDLEYEGQHYIIVHNGDGVAITPVLNNKEKVEPTEEPVVEEAKPAEPDNFWNF